MTEIAFQLQEEALRAQHIQNEARRIRTRVSEARGQPHAAGLRWPFELLQNALDAGPREAKLSVSVVIQEDKNGIRFQHDGAPFTPEDLAALLSGGSSKEFESEITTGRFGTGFLVTHVIAEQTNVQGLLKVPDGYEQFNLILDRRGDEQAILENMQSCHQAIRAASAVVDIREVPSAIFQYPIRDIKTISLGLSSLKSALPLLYLTRPSLGQVTITTDEGDTEIWMPGEMQEEPLEGGRVQFRSVAVVHNNIPLPLLRVLKFTIQQQDSGSALIRTEQTDGDDWKVLIPSDNEPRIYREYPLRGSSFIPTNFIFDGKFKPDQERSRLLMEDGDKEILVQAFGAAVIGTKYAIEQRWQNAHWLASASSSTTSFDSTNQEEKDWWNHQLTVFAQQLARLPIVETSSRFLPAVTDESDDWYVDFVIPRLLDDSLEDETTVRRLWPLVQGATELEPPSEPLAADWTVMALGWKELGLDLGLITVSRLAEYVREGAEFLDRLKVNSDPLDWLANYLDVVGECWEKRSGVDETSLRGILSDQNKRLRSPSELSKDSGIKDALKDICLEIGIDIRSELLLETLTHYAGTTDLKFLRTTLARAVTTSIAEDDVIGRLVKKLNDEFEEDKDYGTLKLNVQSAGVRLLHFLWVERGKDASLVAKKIPLITSNHRIVRWSHDRMMMAPVQSWNQAARPFALAYPPERVLAETYAQTNDQGDVELVNALIQWGVAIADPLTTSTPAELTERRLASMAAGNTDGVLVKDVEFSWIALLHPEVINRCQEAVDEAQALLGLVLCYLAPNDLQWRTEKTVKGRQSRVDIDVPLRTGALWLGDLTYRSWVPVLDDEGKPTKKPADASTLKNILKSEWLEQNDSAIELLSTWFGFDELELRLLGVAPDNDQRQRLRDGLAKLVEFGGGDPDVYESLIEDMEARRRATRDVHRCRRLGLAVQDGIKQALERYQLTVTLVDRGFDYEVSAENVLEDAGFEFQVGSYFVEVKATTSGDARLTPTQATTSSQHAEKYVLCVVDLRNISEDELEMPWDGNRVEPLAKIVADIGGKVESTCRLVTEAKNNTIGIRNDAALRYEVPTSVWSTGSSISEWVDKTWKR